MTRPRIGISACLLGEPCRFDGRSAGNEPLIRELKDYLLIPVCPEVAGGLGTPRPPAEIQGERVRRKNGEDVTEAFERGAQISLAEIKASGCEGVVLKSRSPACGCGQVYDGTFTRTLRTGDGVFTQQLKAAGIMTISDEEIDTAADIPASNKKS